MTNVAVLFFLTAQAIAIFALKIVARYWKIPKITLGKWLGYFDIYALDTSHFPNLKGAEIQDSFSYDEKTSSPHHNNLAYLELSIQVGLSFVELKL